MSVPTFLWNIESVFTTKIGKNCIHSTDKTLSVCFKLGKMGKMSNKNVRAFSLIVFVTVKRFLIRCANSIS